MAVDGYSVRVMSSLLDGSETALAEESSAAQTGSISEAFGGLPMKIPGGASDQNIKLGMLTNPLFLKVTGGPGISVKIASGGSALEANPWLFLSDLDAGLGISEIWVSNSDASEQAITILAGE